MLGPLDNDRRVITGDFKCRLPAYSLLELRPRDYDFIEYIHSKNLTVANHRVATCTHQGRYTTNDYTLITEECAVDNWYVLEDAESLWDHRYIVFNIQLETPIKSKIQVKLCTDEGIYDAFTAEAPIFLPYTSIENTEASANTRSYWLEFAVEAATIESEIKREVIWWNDNLSLLQSHLESTQPQSS